MASVLSSLPQGEKRLLPPSYLAISVPRPPVLRVLALALAFLLTSIGKFAQQRLRGSCRERSRRQSLVRRIIGGSCNPSEGQKPFWTRISPLLPSYLSLSLPCSFHPPMELLDKFPDWRCWQALPTPAQAGSPWKSIAGYCWNNNHSNRSCKYLWDGNAGPLCQPKLISRRRSCSWRIISLCFTLTAIFFYLKFYAFFHSATISTSVSLGFVE